MLKTTISDLLGNRLNGENLADHFVYIVRNEEVVFYIGKSERDVVERLLTHLGQGAFGWSGFSGLGQLAKENMPEALDWQVVFMTGQDCVSAIAANSDWEAVTNLDGSVSLRKEQRVDSRGFRYGSRIGVDDAEGLECELIQILRPCLNTMCNPAPTPLPDKYIHVRPNGTWDKVAKLLGLDET